MESQLNCLKREYLTPLNSRLPYAVIKNVGECFCKSYKQEYGLDYTIFRFFLILMVQDRVKILLFQNL